MNIPNLADEFYEKYFTIETLIKPNDPVITTKALNEFYKLILHSDNKIIINKIVTKLIMIFEESDNIIKFQIYKFLRRIERYYDIIMNKRELLEMIAKILTSDNQIWRSICMKIIISFKNFTQDRIDIFHMIINVAIITKNKTEFKIAFSTLANLACTAETYAFILLKKLPDIIDKAEFSIPTHYLFRLIDAISLNINKADIANELIDIYAKDLQSPPKILIENLTPNDIISTRFKCHTICQLGRNSPMNILKALNAIMSIIDYTDQITKDDDKTYSQMNLSQFLLVLLEVAPYIANHAHIKIINQFSRIMRINPDFIIIPNSIKLLKILVCYNENGRIAVIELIKQVPYFQKLFLTIIIFSRENYQQIYKIFELVNLQIDKDDLLNNNIEILTFLTEDFIIKFSEDIYYFFRGLEDINTIYLFYALFINWIQQYFQIILQADLTNDLIEVSSSIDSSSINMIQSITYLLLTISLGTNLGDFARVNDSETSNMLSQIMESIKNIMDTMGNNIMLLILKFSSYKGGYPKELKKLFSLYEDIITSCCNLIKAIFYLIFQKIPIRHAIDMEIVLFNSLKSQLYLLISEGNMEETTIISNYVVPTLYRLIKKGCYLSCPQIAYNLIQEMKQYITGKKSIITWITFMEKLCVSTLEKTTDEERIILLFESLSDLRLFTKVTNFKYKLLEIYTDILCEITEIRQIIQENQNPHIELSKRVKNLNTIISRFIILKEETYLIDMNSKSTLDSIYILYQGLCLILEDTINNANLEFTLMKINEIKKVLHSKIKTNPFADAEEKILAILEDILEPPYEMNNTINLADYYLNKFINRILHGYGLILPRHFFKFYKDPELAIKFNEEIDRKTSRIRVNSALDYILETRSIIQNLSQTKFYHLGCLNISATLIYHHNYGNPNDTINIIKKLTKVQKITKNGVIDTNFLFSIKSIGVITTLFI